MNAYTRIALVILSLLVVTARAATAVVVPVESVESFVNIRFAPDAKSEIVGQLHQGSSVQFVATEDGWHEVELDGGGTGYVSADWAVVVEEEQAAASEEPMAGDAIESAVDADVDIVATVVDDAAVEEIEVEETTDEDPVAEDVVADVVEETVVEDAVIEETVVEETAVEETVLEETIVEDIVVENSPVERASAPATTPLPVNFKGSVDYLVKFSAPTEGGASQIFDNGRNVGIGTENPQQRLEVNGNIQIHEQNSNVAGLMITQSSGDMGYIMHNRASTLTIGAGSIDRITITRDGNVGFGVNRPAHPVEMTSGAHVTAGGVWTNSSSIEKKENVRELTPEEALAALVALQPVKFNYKADDAEDYVGFIAEDVPALVATADRSGLSAMDIVAVLTSVVQQQQKKIDELEARLNTP